jgi:hypothetical protein
VDPISPDSECERVPDPDVDPDLAREIAPYRSVEGTLKFPLDKPMPHQLITEVAARLLEQRREGQR